MLAVTTRNKLKSARFLLPMLIARRRVRSQMRNTRGLLRWADAIASPTEFYTLTCWSDKQVMFNFMASDAHRDIMWLFSKWSDEFWSMRWSPSPREIGDWDEMRFARHEAPEPRRRTPLDDFVRAPRVGAGTLDPSSCPVTAVLARVELRDLGAARRLRQSWRRLQQRTPQPLRAALGSVEVNQYLLLSIWPQGDEHLLSSLANELPNSWVMQWRPGDYEIGHWDGLRLRQVASAARRAAPSHTNASFTPADERS